MIHLLQVPHQFPPVGGGKTCGALLDGLQILLAGAELPLRAGLAGLAVLRTGAVRVIPLGLGAVTLGLTVLALAGLAAILASLLSHAVGALRLVATVLAGLLSVLARLPCAVGIRILPLGLGAITLGTLLGSALARAPILIIALRPVPTVLVGLRSIVIA